MLKPLNRKEKLNQILFPKPPLGRILYDYDYDEKKLCSICHSSLKRKNLMISLLSLGFFDPREKGCIHPECDNYYEK